MLPSSLPPPHSPPRKPQRHKQETRQPLSRSASAPTPSDKNKGDRRRGRRIKGVTKSNSSSNLAAKRIASPSYNSSKTTKLATKASTEEKLDMLLKTQRDRGSRFPSSSYEDRNTRSRSRGKAGRAPPAPRGSPPSPASRGFVTASIREELSKMLNEQQHNRRKLQNSRNIVASPRFKRRHQKVQQQRLRRTASSEGKLGTFYDSKQQRTVSEGRLGSIFHSKQQQQQRSSSCGRAESDSCSRGGNSPARKMTRSKQQQQRASSCGRAESDSRSRGGNSTARKMTRSSPRRDSRTHDSLKAQSDHLVRSNSGSSANRSKKNTSKETAGPSPVAGERGGQRKKQQQGQRGTPNSHRRRKGSNSPSKRIHAAKEEGTIDFYSMTPPFIENDELSSQQHQEKLTPETPASLSPSSLRKKKGKNKQQPEPAGVSESATYASPSTTKNTKQHRHSVTEKEERQRKSLSRHRYHNSQLSDKKEEHGSSLSRNNLEEKGLASSVHSMQASEEEDTPALREYDEQDIFSLYTWSQTRQDPSKIQSERQQLKESIRDSPLYRAYLAILSDA